MSRSVNVLIFLVPVAMMAARQTTTRDSSRVYDNYQQFAFPSASDNQKKPKLSTLLANDSSQAITGPSMRRKERKVEPVSSINAASRLSGAQNGCNPARYRLTLRHGNCSRRVETTVPRHTIYR